MSDGSHERYIQHQDILANLHEQKVINLVSGLGAKLSKDGNKWCWLYGDNLMVGVIAFGNSPMEAADAFYKEFNTDIPEPK